MSSYGSALVVDLDTRSGLETILDRLRAASDFDAGRSVLTGPTQLGQTWRLTAYLGSFAIENELRDTWLTGVGSGKAVVGDDFDDYGAIFTAWQLQEGTPTVVYRAIIPGPQEAELTLPAQAGPDAARSLASLFGVNEARLLDIDSDLDSLSDELGIIGGPFPWFEALELEWPGG